LRWTYRYKMPLAPGEMVGEFQAPPFEQAVEQALGFPEATGIDVKVREGQLVVARPDD
jgi:hypothetical protein